MTKFTLLNALSNLYSSNKDIHFEIHFYDVERTCIFGKTFDDENEVKYYIKETHRPKFQYNEEQFVGALAKISGITLHFERANYIVTKTQTYTRFNN